MNHNHDDFSFTRDALDLNMIGEPSRYSPRSARILIVDDEPRLRDVWQRAIGLWGFETRGARSAEEAIKLASSSAFDIAIIDLNLPVMGGMELFQRLRALNPRLQVIVVTGFGDLESARSAIRLDVIDFIQKPCPLGDLERAIDRATRRLAPPIAEEPPPPLAAEPPIANAQSSITLQDVERDHILSSLRRHRGNRTATAQELGISRRTLQYKLNEYQRQGFEFD